MDLPGSEIVGTSKSQEISFAEKSYYVGSRRQATLPPHNDGFDETTNHYPAKWREQQLFS